MNTNFTTSDCARCSEYFYVDQKIEDENVVTFSPDEDRGTKGKKICTSLHQHSTCIIVANTNEENNIQKTNFDLEEEATRIKKIL